MTHVDKMKAFEVHKLKMLILSTGIEYIFTDNSVTNEFGEPIKGEGAKQSIKGVWHTTNGYIQKTATEATNIRKKQSPQLLCLTCDLGGICTSSVLTYNDKTYHITDIIDVNNFGVISDICLEEVLKG